MAADRRRRSSADSVGIGKVTAQLRRRLSSDIRPVKIAILGMPAVGKSALAVRFLTRRFIGEYDEFLESKYSCTLAVEDELVSFEVMDLCIKIVKRNKNGEHDEEHLKWADGFLLVYDVTRRETFTACSEFRTLALDTRRSMHNQTPMMLLGNKADLWQARQVTRQDGEEMAALFNCPFSEVTAAEDYLGVQRAFITLYKEIRGHKACPRTLLDRLFKTRRKS